jgi:hypothetical protein
MRINIFSFLILIFLAAIVVGQTTVTNESKLVANKRGAITGQILADDGQPLIGIGVRAMRFAGDRTVSRPATTDEEGNFKVDDLPLGSYRVVPQVSGYVNAPGNNRLYRTGESATFTMVKGGVITGKVLDGAGQPLVGATVQALRTRDGEGRTKIPGSSMRDAQSDDRGTYRIYGLEAGSYVVSTSGGYGMYYNDGVIEAPTYHPNGTRDTAQEVVVQQGSVVTGIDVRHRGERGALVSGTFSGLVEFKSESGPGPNVALTHATTNSLVAQAYAAPGSVSKSGFAFYGIADGEYELSARRQVFNRQAGDVAAASEARKIVVKGSDVTGIDLKLLPLASIAGRIALEPIEKKDCPITRRGGLEELTLTYQRDENDARTLGLTETALDEKYEFVFQELLAGRYRLIAQLPSDHWYLKAMTVTAPTKTPAAKPLDVARQGLNVKSGEKLTGVMLTIAEGAAELRGRIEGKNLPARLRVHLVPAEKDDGMLRYAEIVTREGAFTFPHLAPGQYWLLARPVPDDESDEKPAKPMAWDANQRAALRREAEAANQAITLTTCQRAKDFILKFEAGVK